jgi:DNA-binding GntR family transcriptional regulator
LHPLRVGPDMTELTDLSMRVVTIAAPVRTQVVESLRQAITDGRLAPGLRLVEKDLCKMLGVSRPSVREALRALEVEGLISSIPNRGPVVTELSPADAASIYEVRGALESLAARLFAANASDESIAALDQAATLLEASYDTEDVTRMIMAKRDFYEVFFRGTNNKIIPEILRTMNARITRLRAVGLASPERREASRKEIRQLVDALKKRDGAAAAEISRHHVEEAARAALQSLPN